MQEPYRRESFELIRANINTLTSFSPSAILRALMPGYLGIPAEKMRVVPVGIKLRGYEPRARDAEKEAVLSPSFSSRASRRRRACTCWPKAKSSCAERRWATRGSKSRATWRGAQKLFESVERQMREWGLAVSSTTEAFSTASRRSNSARPRRALRPRAYDDRRNVPARAMASATPSSSRAAARSRRSSNAPAAACSSSRTTRRHSPKNFIALRKPPLAGELGERGVAACVSTTRSRGWPTARSKSTRALAWRVGSQYAERREFIFRRLIIARS